MRGCLVTYERVETCSKQLLKHEHSLDLSWKRSPRNAAGCKSNRVLVQSFGNRGPDLSEEMPCSAFSAAGCRSVNEAFQAGPRLKLDAWHALLQVAGAGESLFEALEKGPNTGSGMSSLAGLAALAQTVGCNLIYPVLIRKSLMLQHCIVTSACSQPELMLETAGCRMRQTTAPMCRPTSCTTWLCCTVSWALPDYLNG